MALTTCKNCGKTISDQALICPHCGISLVEESSTNENTKPSIICPECGSEILEEVASCPYCGYPLEKNSSNNMEKTTHSEEKVETPKKTNSKSTKKILSIVIVFLLIIGLGIVGFLIHKDKLAKEEALRLEAEAERAREEYKQNIAGAVNKMLSGAVEAEEAGGLIHDVWYNSIFEEDDVTTDKYTKNSSGKFFDDFNEALRVLFSDNDFIKKTNNIKKNQAEVADYMKSLTNPPEEFTEAYSTIKDLYDVYLDMTGYATNPTGNLGTFTTSFNEADSDFMKYYKKMQQFL